MTYFKSLFALSLVLILTACVTGTRQVAIEMPEFELESTNSGNVSIVLIEDKRAFEQKPKKPEIPSVSGKLDTKTTAELSTFIGRQRNGYGGAMGSVILAEQATVQQEVRRLLEAGLQQKGFTIADDANAERQLQVEIEKFWAWMVPGFISIGFESELDLLLKSGGKQAKLSGSGNNEGQVASNANWALTYRRAYKNLLENLSQALEELDW